jgi:Na+-transporting NADH:ubiquinone oxidoreductase subunit F
VTDLINKRIPKGADLEVYICGSPEMVDSSWEALKKKGIAEEKVYFDKFS